MQCSKCGAPHERKHYYCGPCANEYARNRRLTKGDIVKAYHNEYTQQKRRSDPSFRLAHALRNRVVRALKGGRKPGSAVADLGCTVGEFRVYLESKFQPGMSWESYGKWHVDHIKPLASFDLTDREQFLQACHYTNMQPLWAEENLKKGDRDGFQNPEA